MASSTHPGKRGLEVPPRAPWWSSWIRQERAHLPKLTRHMLASDDIVSFEHIDLFSFLLCQYFKEIHLQMSWLNYKHFFQFISFCTASLSLSKLMFGIKDQLRKASYLSFKKHQPQKYWNVRRKAAFSLGVVPPLQLMWNLIMCRLSLGNKLAPVRRHVETTESADKAPPCLPSHPTSHTLLWVVIWSLCIHSNSLCLVILSIS